VPKKTTHQIGGHGDRLEKGVSRLRIDDGCDHEQPILVRKFKRRKRVPQRTREMRFRSLHHHSTYSFLDGFQLPAAHVRRAVEIGMPALALTEHGNTSSHVQLEVAANKEGIKPIFGVELYCGYTDEERHTQRKNHLTILAENQRGYTNLLKLVGETYADGFYYEPTASGPMLAAHKEGIVVLSGCNSSLLYTSLLGGKNIAPEDASYERAKKVAANFKRTFGDSYYIEVQAFPELAGTCIANREFARIGAELGIPLVASFDCHYTVPEESEIQKVLHNVRGGGRQTLEEQSRNWGYDIDLCPPWTDRMVLSKLMATGLTRKQAIDATLATEDIADRCNVVIPSLPMVRYPLRRGQDAVQVWREWLREGWARRGCNLLPAAERQRYQERLKYEVGIIEDKDFVDYFLIVADVVKWAKDHDILVTVRGSAVASIVCWLLRITELDPMPYPNLVFERFIDVSREDMPDIDIDSDSDDRDRVIAYLVSKYGRECVNNIANFATYKNKLALDDTARVYRIPGWEVDRVKDVLIDRSSGDLRASATIEDTVEQFEEARLVFERHPDLVVAMELEGNVKGMGIHAAGLVISSEAVTDVCAVYERVVKGKVRKVLSLNKYDCERKNLLKIDWLGLKTNTFLNQCRLELGWTLDDLHNLPFDDEVVLDGFRRNDVVGIFQFDGRACRYVCGALAPDTFDHICDITALARPGPLHNGAANEYIDVKRGAREPTLVHPALDAITQSTYQQIVYQEQILRIVVEIGDFGWTHAAEIRRIMSRKTGEQAFNRKRDEFLAGAKTLEARTGFPPIDPATALAIWGDCITAGAYAFNAAHALAYGAIGYYTQFFKQHHPDLFFEKALRYMNPKKQPSLIRDAARGHGPRQPVEIQPPHPSKSKATWSREGKVVRAGWQQFSGVAEKTAAAIEAYREEHAIRRWEDLLNIKGIGPKTLSKIKEFVTDDDPFGALYIDRAISQVKREIREGELSGVVPVPTHVSSDLPYSRGEDIEVVWLGLVHTRNQRDLFEFNQAKGKVIDMKAMTIDGKKIKDPHLSEWMVMVADDESDQIGLLVDRWKYPRFKNQLWSMRLGYDLLLVRGVKPHWMPTRQISISEMWVIDPELK
jgi:DNA polymerase III subunit alpha